MITTSRTPGFVSAKLSRISLKTASSSAPTKANEMEIMKKREMTIAMPTMNVGPSGTTPAEACKSNLNFGAKVSFLRFFDRGDSVLAIEGRAALSDPIWPRTVRTEALVLATLDADDGVRRSPVVERKE